VSIHHRVQAWLVQRGREQWIIAGGPDRLELCETWRAVSLRYGDESPPALGCLLALVREARNDLTLVTDFWREVQDPVAWAVVQQRGVKGRIPLGHGAREVDALINTLEASP
jgi:hypothetical protein